MPSSVGRPRKIKNESKIKNETDSSTASESDNDEIEILSVSDAVITLSDEDSQNSSMDCSDILDDSGINLTEGGDGTEAVKENQEGSGEIIATQGRNPRPSWHHRRRQGPSAHASPGRSKCVLAI